MTAILDLPEIQARVQRWTVAAYEWLAEQGRLSGHTELIRGIIVEKMPKSPLHAYLTNGIRGFFQRVARHGFIVRQENPLRLVDSMPEPDVAVVRGEEKDFRSHHPTTAELVVEITVSSAALDRENASLYAEANVTEYWIVLGTEEKVEVYREPVNGVYQSRRVYGRGEIIDGVSAVEGAVAVDELFV